MEEPAQVRSIHAQRTWETVASQPNLGDAAGEERALKFILWRRQGHLAPDAQFYSAGLICISFVSIHIAHSDTSSFRERCSQSSGHGFLPTVKCYAEFPAALGPSTGTWN
jgi:hypothetical protein